MQNIKLPAPGAQKVLRIARLCAFGVFCVLPSALAVPACAQIPSSPEAEVQHAFVFKADRKVNAVTVAGTFNNWNKTANPMTADADGLTWRTNLSLTYGKYLYKFVLDSENWIVDSQASRNETDAGGNTNSVVLVLPTDYKIPANPDDGQTAASALFYQPRAPYLNFDQGKLTFSFRARPKDLRQVWLKALNRRYTMKIVKSDDLYAVYRAEIAWDRKTNLSYRFLLQDGKRFQEFGAGGLASQSRPFRLIAKDFQPYEVPNWVERTVFYQVFPDRFANGDKNNDPPGVQPWDAAPTGFSRFGGDVAGVRQHLPYLGDLGVSGVYFNPVFKSPSNHRYDAQDFKQIDPEFGSNAEFAALTKELQGKGIRTVMDFVFNHTATTFAPFADIREKGASSPYKDWFFIKSYPVRVQQNPNYVAWNNYASMPKLNLLNPETSDYMLNLVDFWKKQVPLAGLRLDVANEVDIRFWRKLRQRVKGLDPQMWIVGEVWGDGSPWLSGDQWDSVMNYPFLFACAGFFAEGKSSSSEFANRLMEIYNSYPPQVSRNMMNLLSSHDTPRFLNRCGNDANLQRLAATVQFTWVGAPSIYYGEELGMEGGMDPDNRRGMQWDKATPDNEMLRYYKRLIQIRNANRALQSGEPSILLANDKAKTIAYARIKGNEIAIVALNCSNSPQDLEIALPRSAAVTKALARGFVDAITKKPVAVGAGQSLKIQLAPLTSAILLPASAS